MPLWFISVQRINAFCIAAGAELAVIEADSKMKKEAHTLPLCRSSLYLV